MSEKMGFWAVFALVTASQIGSGILTLPTALAPYGYYGLFGWLIASTGAIALALVFATLCSWYPETGGPHIYVHKAFGDATAFFAGWTYWVISWFSTTAVIIACTSYLTPLIGNQEPYIYCGLQIMILSAIIWLNLKGVKTTGSMEILLSGITCLLIVIMPLIALFFFDSAHIITDTSVANLPLSHTASRTALLILWGFIGLESATASAGSVENPTKTIPKAVILGTLAVATLYLLNTVAIMGLIPGNMLMFSKAPYAEAAQHIFGSGWHLIVSFMASVGLIGTLNAWILTSSQVALGLAQNRFLPQFFMHKNSNNVPTYGLLISCAGIIPLLVLTMNANLAKQITDIIDISVTAFLFIYLICSLGFLKLLMQQKRHNSAIDSTKDSALKTKICFTTLWQWTFGLTATAFCSWILYNQPIQMLLIASLFVFSGLPLYYFWYRPTHN